MKMHHLSVCAGLGSTMILSSGTHAAYMGLTAHMHTRTMVGQGMGQPELRDVFRVYAVFTDPDDYLTWVAGSPTVGNMVIRTWNPTFSGPGGPFINPLGGGATSPYYTYLGTQVQWDTFVTIGLSSWGDPNGPAHQLTDGIGLSPGFQTGLPNSGIFQSDTAGWFVGGAQPQGRAGNGLPLGSGLWGVLLLQLTVNTGNFVAGTVAIGGVNNSPLAGGVTFQATGQSFLGWPAPGGIAAMTLLAAMGPRRRRS